MSKYCFSMSGRMGDEAYSLYFCTQRADYQPFDYYLQTNKPDGHDPGGRKVFQTPAEAEFFASILREQPYIRSVGIGDAECVPAADITNYINLDLFRETPELYGLSEIRNWCYRLSSLKPDSFARQVLTIPPSDLKKQQKLCICFTGRYKPVINPGALQPIADKLVYVGLPREYDTFCSKYFKVDYKPVKSAKEMLQYIDSTCGFIGNISGSYALVECSKLPRILCLPGGSHGDVRPYGGRAVAVLDNHKLLKEAKALLS